MAGNSFDVGERKTHEIDSSKPLEFNDAFEGFAKTKRESFTNRVKTHSGVHLDTPTSTPQQSKQVASEPEETVEQQAVSTPDFSETAETQHHDWFEWVKQFRSVDTQPVTRINGLSVVPSVKKAIARLARLGMFEQRIMLDALDLMTKDEHMTVVNSYYDSFATDANDGGYSHDDEDIQQYAQQLAESQQRERELQDTIDSLRAELAEAYGRIEHEDARAQVDAGLKGTAADPHRDDNDSAPVIDGAADAEEELTIDQPDERASQDADKAGSDETADDSAADGDDDKPVIDNPSSADDESDDNAASDDEDSDVEGFDDFASEMEDDADEDAASAAQAAQDQQEAEAQAAAELEQEQQAEAQEQAEGE